MRIGLFPGTFDPPSKGHLDLIERAAPLFDQLIIGIGQKLDKKPLFSQKEREEMLRMLTKELSHVDVASFQGLTTQFAKEKNVTFLVRGLRSVADFEAELQMALANQQLSGIETLFLMANHIHISSSLIREIAHFGGSLHALVPKEIEPLIRQKLRGTADG